MSVRKLQSGTQPSRKPPTCTFVEKYIISSLFPGSELAVRAGRRREISRDYGWRRMEAPSGVFLSFLLSVCLDGSGGELWVE